MLWLDKEKIKITNKLKAKYTEARHCILQLQIPLTTTERLQNWIKLGLWLILIAILFLLISLDWTVLASLYATVMTVIFWLKGWDQIASKLAQYWQKQRLEKEVIDSRLTHNSRSTIAEQRLLNILTIITDWQSLSPEDRSLKSLHVLAAIYRIAIGILPTTTTSVIKSSTTSIATTAEATSNDGVTSANEPNNKDIKL